MAYEKKIEPISRWEIFLCGLTLQLFIIFFFVLPWMGLSEECLESIFETDIQEKDDLIKFHKCIKKHRPEILGGCTCLLIGYPIIISHLYYDKRLFETLGAFLNTGLLRSLYAASWGIAATIYCTVIPALGIFVVYYDWEFSDNSTSNNNNNNSSNGNGYNSTSTSHTYNNIDNEYLGYVMQFQMMQFLLILWDCLAIPLGLAAGIPWISDLIILFGGAKSKHYKLSQSGREQLLGRVTYCKCGKWALAVFFIFLIGVCILGGIGDSLDFEKDGFWSYHGGSQFLEIVLFIAWELQSIFIMIFACQLDAHRAFLNENVESMAAQDNVEMISAPPR